MEVEIPIAVAFTAPRVDGFVGMDVAGVGEARSEGVPFWSVHSTVAVSTPNEPLGISAFALATAEGVVDGDEIEGLLPCDF